MCCYLDSKRLVAQNEHYTFICFNPSQIQVEAGEMSGQFFVRGAESFEPRSDDIHALRGTEDRYRVALLGEHSRNHDDISGILVHGE